MKAGQSLKRYRVYCRKSGKLLAEGRASVCAEKIHMTLHSFRALVSQSARGETRFRIEVETRKPEDQEANEAAMRQWDLMVRRVRRALDAPVMCPCRGCAWRSLCSHMDVYCRAWAAWWLERRVRHDAG